MPEGGKTKLVFRELALSEQERQKYLGLSTRRRALVLKKPATWKEKKVTVSAGECAPAKYRGHGFECWFVKDRVKISDATSYAKLPSGLGYIYLRKVRGQSQAANLKTAFTALADCKGLVVDMRWNGGGGGESYVAACFPGRGKSEDGSRWTKPVAVLIGPRVMSSGDSVAYWLKGDLRHPLFGEHTSGASGPKNRFNLPSGFAEVGYVRSHWGSRSLEGIGVAPTTRVLQDVVELSLGIDSVRAAAERHLKKVTR
jgi:C-terminal processing protease CtpA/Prc